MSPAALSRATAEREKIGLVDEEYLERPNAHNRACLQKNGYWGVPEHEL